MGAMSRRRTAMSVLGAAVLLTAAACSGGADTSPSVTSTAAANNDAQASAATAPGGSTSALDPAIIERAASYDEVTTAEGAQVMVAVECDSQSGGDLLHAGSVGLPEGIYVGTVEPSVGGKLTFQVGSDGIGYQARQTTLDQSSYTITYADIDGGTELTVTGCTG